MSNTPEVVPAMPRMAKLLTEATAASVVAPKLFNMISLLCAAPPTTVPVWPAPIMMMSCPLPPTKDWLVPFALAEASSMVMTPDDALASIAAVLLTPEKSPLKSPAPERWTVATLTSDKSPDPGCVPWKNFTSTASLNVTVVAAKFSILRLLVAAFVALMVSDVAFESET